MLPVPLSGSSDILEVPDGYHEFNQVCDDVYFVLRVMGTASSGSESGRYRDTRGFKSKVGNILLMGMQFQIIHHLYPRIPLLQTPAAYFALMPILQKRGCNLGDL